MRAKSFFTSISCTIALALCSAVAIAAPTHLHALGQGGRLAGNLVILAAHGGFGMRHAMIGHPMMGHPMIGHSMIGRGVMGPRFIGGCGSLIERPSMSTISTTITDTSSSSAYPTPTTTITTTMT